jgi:cell division protein FtsL
MAKDKESKDQKPKPRRTRSRSGEGFAFWDFGFKRGGDLSQRTAKLLLVLLLVIWLVAGIYLVVVSQTMIAARRIQALRDELAYLQKENAILEEAIADRLSVANLWWAAENDGLSPSNQVEFVEP